MGKGLLETRGKRVRNWQGIAHKTKFERHKAAVDFIKARHGFTTDANSEEILKEKKKRSSASGKIKLLVH